MEMILRVLERLDVRINLKSGGPFSNELRLISIDLIVNNMSIGSGEIFVVLTNNLLTKLKTACTNKTFSHRILIQNYNVDDKPIKRKYFLYFISYGSRFFFPVEQSGKYFFVSHHRNLSKIIDNVFNSVSCIATPIKKLLVKCLHRKLLEGAHHASLVENSLCFMQRPLYEQCFGSQNAISKLNDNFASTKKITIPHKRSLCILNSPACYLTY